MEIKTKFALGDKVWTIRNCKAVSFEVACILWDDGGIYYGVSCYDYTSESHCFASKEEMLKYVAEDGNENV